ncbi:uncharacterized protein VTP21DRAFT_2097 [Calcarisporiella thermophila]|uniref:uncharacterized protein n=1 Tax=Calcarisporiella thermophila TaxID=911321 RepID=UPI003743AE7C
MPKLLRPSGFRMGLIITFICVALLIIASSRHMLLRSTRSKFTGSESYPRYEDNTWEYHESLDVHHPNPNLRAAIVTYARNDQLHRVRPTMRNIEDSFNAQHGYPYIIFSDEDFSDEFKELVSSLPKNASVIFKKIPEELWGYPKWINMEKANATRQAMKGILYGDSEFYRLQSRFLAGTMFKDPIFQNYDYFWRFEPGSEFLCSLSYDPFEFMHKNGIKYTFSVSMYEYHDTIPTLWRTMQEFAEKNSDLVYQGEDGIRKFMLNEQGDFNLCHFWTNFLIGDLKFFRGEQYTKYFDFLDKSGGIFYERWGDAVMTSLSAYLFLSKKEVHFWNDIGYRVSPFLHCPAADTDVYKTCACKVEDNFDFNPYSCLKKWLELK